MPVNNELLVDKQLSYVIGLLQNRRDRYRLWWNALTGAMVAIGVGIIVGIVSGKVAWGPVSSFLLDIKVATVLTGILLVIVILFLFIFFELHLIDDIAERVVFQFWTTKEPFVEDNLPLIVWALRFIEDPIPGKWKQWKNVERETLVEITFIICLFAVVILMIRSAQIVGSYQTFLGINPAPLIFLIMFIVGLVAIWKRHGTQIFKGGYGRVLFGLSSLTVYLLLSLTFRPRSDLLDETFLAMLLLFINLTIISIFNRSWIYAEMRAQIRQPIDPSVET